jgi:type III secretion protein V
MRQLLVPGLVLIGIGSIIIPLPTAVIDSLIVGNILLALLLLFGAFCLAEPTKFSALPAILLIGVVARLALAISTTRLILSRGDAGQVIHTFGSLVVGDTLVVGVVIFVIICIVQFLVITKGSERVAEVSARFALDALPAKQMSIDADLRSGLIDPQTAQKRRQELQIESRLYGALDGAMKFVKGDTLAGILIAIVNATAGLLLGVTRDGMGLMEAVSRYTILTVGDGLVGQIPSLITCVGAGIMVTRVSRGDGQSVSEELTGQLGALGAAQAYTGIAALSLALIPGMPHIFCLLAGVMLLAKSVTPGKAAVMPQPEKYFSPVLPSPIVITLSSEVTKQEELRKSFAELIEGFRSGIYEEFGVILPSIRTATVVADGTASVQIKVFEQIVLTSPIEKEGELSAEPMNTFSSYVKDHIQEFINDSATRSMLQVCEQVYPELVQGAVPAVISVPQLTLVIRNLVREGVSVKFLDRVIQLVAERPSLVTNVRLLTEEARYVLRAGFAGALAKHGPKLEFASLHPAVDALFLESERTGKVPDAGLIEQLMSFVLHEVLPENLVGLVVSRGSRALVADLLALGQVPVRVFSREELYPIAFATRKIFTPTNLERSLEAVAGQKAFLEQYDVVQ